MSVSRISTVWCDGLDGYGAEHADGCTRWSGEGMDAREARSRSDFIQRPGGKDYRACLAALESGDRGASSGGARLSG